MGNYNVGTIQVGFSTRNVTKTIENIDKLILKLEQLSKVSNVIKSSFDGVKNLNINTSSITKATKQTQKLEVQSAKVKSNFQNMFSLGKIYFYLNYSKRLFQSFGKIINASVAFEETLNKFEVSFSSMSDEAIKFANEMTYAFNLSKQSIMDYMSTFNSMLKGLEGLSDEQASTLAQTVTQLSLDYSSLFNVGVDSAMTAFQSVLSGQIKTIRSVSGIDVSEQSLFSYYEDLGGTKSVRQLDQLEKRLLRIYAVQKQMEELGAFEIDEEGEAFGDLEKTINSTSNQLKQISETTQELSLYLGLILRQFFNPVIEKSLALLLTLKDVTKAFAAFKDLTTTSYNEGNGLFGEMEEDITGVDEALDGLSNKLSFDKFEVLGDSSSSQTSELERILSAISDYNNTFANIESNARKTADSILTWLGYFSKIDEETGETLWILDPDSYTNIEKLLDLLKLLGIYVGITLSAKFVKFAASLLTTSTTMVDLNKIIATGTIFLLLKLIESINNGEKGMTAFYTILVLVGASIMLYNSGLIPKLIINLGVLTSTLSKLQLRLLGVSVVLGVVTAGFFLFMNMDSYSQRTKVFIGVLAGLAAILSVVAIAALAANSALTFGIGAGLSVTAFTAGAVAMKAMISSADDIPQYATGAYDIDQGQMFIAREKGPELVGNIGNKSTVANNDQIVKGISQGVYEAVIKANTDSGGQNITFNLSGYSDSGLARLLSKPMIEEFNRQGYKINKV